MHDERGPIVGGWVSGPQLAHGIFHRLDAAPPIGQAPAEFSSTYIYSTILALYLVGTTIGGFLVKRIPRANERALHYLGAVQLGIGLFTIVAINLERTVFLDRLLPKLVEIASIVLPTTILMGIGFPLLASALVSSMERSGQQF